MIVIFCRDCYTFIPDVTSSTAAISATAEAKYPRATAAAP